jgi:hypothetical protein
MFGLGSFLASAVGLLGFLWLVVDAAMDALGDVFRVVEVILDDYSWPILFVLIVYWGMRLRVWRDQ